MLLGEGQISNSWRKNMSCTGHKFEYCLKAAAWCSEIKEYDLENREDEKLQNK